MAAPPPETKRLLPPGFRFHPNDHELVYHYLRRKVIGADLPAGVIADVDLLRSDPWDLLGRSGEEKYFFNMREAKYTSGSRSNRAAASGYWKATGKEKPVVAPSGRHLVGMKRVLVFYRGKPPHGERTDWIMHEYRLAGALATALAAKGNGESACSGERWVVCRIFKKRRSSSSAAARLDGETDDEGRNSSDAENGGGGDVTFIELFGARVAVRRPRQLAAVASPERSCVTDAAEESIR